MTCSEPHRGRHSKRAVLRLGLSLPVYGRPSTIFAFHETG